MGEIINTIAVLGLMESDRVKALLRAWEKVRECRSVDLIYDFNYLMQTLPGHDYFFSSSLD